MKISDQASVGWAQPARLAVTLAIGLLLPDGGYLLPAQASPPNFVEVNMQIRGIAYNKDTGGPSVGWVRVNAAGTSLNAQSSVPAGSGPTDPLVDSGVVPLTMEVGREYAFSYSSERLYSGRLYFGFPTCSEPNRGYWIRIEEDGNQNAIEIVDPEQDDIPVNAGTFTGTIQLLSGLQVTIDSGCGCIETDLPQLIADEHSQTYATVPGMTDLSWSILTPDLGSEIVGAVTNGLGEVQGIIIRAGAEAGKITIQAADGLCLYRGELALVCPVDGEEGCSGGNCKDFGGGNLQNRNGPAVDFGLGGDSPTTSGGSLHLRETIPGTNLTALSTLRLLHPGPNTRAVWDKGGWLRQVRTPLGLVDLVPVSTNNGVLMAYDLRFYRHSSVSTNLEGGYYALLSGQTPEVTWQISNPDSSGDTTNRLRIVEMRGTLNRTNDFEWLSATSRWKQTDGAPAREVYGWRESVGGGVTNLVREVKVGSTVLVRRLRRYEPLQSGSTTNVLTRLEEGVSPALRTTEYTYNPSSAPTGSQGQLRQVLEPDGGWSIYEYDSSGRVSRQYAAFGDQAPTTNAALCRVTEYSYTLTQSPDGVDDDGSWMPLTPRKTIVKVLGNEVSRTYRTLAEGQTIEKICPLPGLLWSNATNLVTTTTTYTDAVDYGRTKSIVHPDGTLTTYAYTATAEGGEIVTNRTGQASGSAVYNGTETVTETGGSGELLSRTTRPVVSSNVQSILIAQDAYTYTDDLKRSYTLVSLGNRTNEVQYACCGLDTEIDWEGTPTSYEYDALGRRVATLRHGITHSNILDAAGRVLVRQRLGTDASVLTQDQYAYDVLGRVTAHTNALQGVTFYSEGLTNNKLHRLTVNPDQGQRLEIYYRDGRLEQVTNSAAFPVRYVHTVEQDGTGGPWREVLVEIRYRGDANTNEWTKTYTDGAGRAYKTVYPAASGTPYRLDTYNNLGQLIQQRDPDGVLTLYQYNSQGQLEYTVLDLDQDGVIDWSGTDRITRLTQGYGSYGGAPVRESTNTVHTTNNSETTAVVGLTRASTDGLKSWSSVFRDGSTAVTTTNQTMFHRPSGARTNITYLPDASRTEQVYSYGRLQSVTRKDSGGAQVTRTSYAYDSHGRVYAVTDARNGTTFTSYNAADQPVFVTTPDPGDGQGPQTSQTFYDTSGRTIGQWLPDGATTTNEYHLTGLLKKTWGARQYPVEYGYDAQGRMTNMVTWQSFNLLAGSGASLATNTWQYDTNRGWLRLKGYPNATTGVATTNGPAYSYTAAGRLKTRSWVRTVAGGARLLTTYKYGFEGTDATRRHGDLIEVTYNDGTPGSTHSHDRRGRPTSVVRSNRTVSWTYNDADRPLTETIAGGTLGGWSVVNEYNNKLQRTHQRLRNGSGTTQQEARFGFDTAGRLSAMTNGLLTGLRAAYSYLPNSSLIGTLAVTNHNTSRGLVTTRQYDGLNRLRTISSKAFGGSASALPVAFDYQYNAANQRTRVNREDGAYWVYQYDELGQVISGRKYWGDGTEVAGQQFDYAFDTIGNRTATGGRASAVSTYTPNRLNQYTQRTVPAQVDVLGVANPTANVTVRVVGGTTYTAARKGEYYHHALNVGNNVYPQVEVKSLYGATQAQTNRVFNPSATETFTHDADGNLTQDGRWTYTWDAENRLVEMKRDTGTPTGARQRLVFEYDHQGRRIRKQFYTHNGSNWVLGSDIAFAYDGWNLVAELNAASSNARIRTYHWGLDLSGTEQGAGGVGGLWLVTDHTSGTVYHWSVYDGNGNVAALVAQANGSLSARYEYGPFGETIRATGPMAKHNPFRFSTKYTDNETGLLYYGYRFYDPVTGRWLNRDPIGEWGGANVYQAFYNNSLRYVDRNGLDNWSNPGAGQNAPPVLFPPPRRDPVNTESKKALWCYLTGGSESFVYGPTDAWTKRMQAHPHMDTVRREIKFQLSRYCAGKGGVLSGPADFQQQDLPAWDKGEWLVNDLVSWITDGTYGTDPGFRFGSFRLRWTARVPDCCCRMAVVLFSGSDVVDTRSMSRNPLTGRPMIPIGEPLGPGLPFHSVPIIWLWTETIEF